MKTAFKNFVWMLKRFKLSSSLNIIGLSVSFAALAIIIAQIRYENSFDRFHANADRIFRTEVAASLDSTSYFPVSSVGMRFLFQDEIPQIEHIAVTDYQAQEVIVHVEKNGQKQPFSTFLRRTEATMIDVMNLELLQGSREDFVGADKVILPQSEARRFYGSEDPIGKRFVSDLSGETYHVVGIYKDLPENTWWKNYVIYPLEINREEARMGDLSYNMMMTLTTPAAAGDVGRQMLQLVLDRMDGNNEMGFRDFRVTALPEIYYAQDVAFDNFPKGSRSTSTLLVAIAVLIIVIAAINFVNFSTSLAPIRIKSINTQKVLGESTARLRQNLIVEAVGLSVVAFLVSLAWIKLFSITPWQHYLMTAVPFNWGSYILWITAGVSLMVGLVAGLYPAIYTTSFPPALVLKGNFGLSPKGRRLRAGMIGFQFIISLGLITAALFMQLQNHFLRNYKTGIDMEQMVLVDLKTSDLTKNRQAIRDRLLNGAQIVDVAETSYLFNLVDTHSRWVRDNAYGESVDYYHIAVGWNMPDILGVHITEGRSFREGDKESTKRLMIFNEAARAKMGYEVGFADNYTEVIGYMENFNFLSLRSGIEPMAFVYNAPDESKNNSLYIKTTGDPYKAADYITSTLKSFDPGADVDLKFQDTVFNTVYAKEKKTTGLITIFSLLAVVISLVGVFGLVVFETQYRRKEIGVRKVFGATIAQILAMLNRSFVKILLVCFLIASPIVWYGVTRWLENFSYRTPIHWWVFLVSLITVMFITLLTVTIQSWRAAAVNPVESLKNN